MKPFVPPKQTVFWRKRKALSVDVRTMALERIADAYKMFDTISVSFSGGKDSTVCLNLAAEVARSLNKGPVDTVFWDEECVAQETVEYIERCHARPDVNVRWVCLPIRHRNGCSRSSPYWFPWAPEDKAKWVRELPRGKNVVTKLERFPMKIEDRITMPFACGLMYPPKKFGRHGMILGVRVQESVNRAASVMMPNRDKPYLRRHEYDTHDYGNVTRVLPIYDWMHEDVWTAPAKLGWDYNRAYDVMDKAGINVSLQRIAPPYGEEPMQNLWMWAVCFPDRWDRMSERVPGAATAARYSRTALYGLGSVLKKPDSMPWATWLKGFIVKHGDMAGFVASRIQRELRRHVRYTNNAPIAEKTPHPTSGVSWEKLQRIAMRGDFKNRKAMKAIGNWDEKTLPQKFEAELKEIRARGGVVECADGPEHAAARVSGMGRSRKASRK